MDADDISNTGLDDLDSPSENLDTNNTVKTKTVQIEKNDSVKQAPLDNSKRGRIALLYVLFAICLLANIGQSFAQFNLQKDADDVSWRLTNYRELQNKQIEAVKQNCSKIEEAFNNTLQQYLKIIWLYNTTLANAYKANINLRCKIPALVISGYTEGEYSENVNKIFRDGSVKLKDNAFDKVKW